MSHWIPQAQPSLPLSLRALRRSAGEGRRTWGRASFPSPKSTRLPADTSRRSWALGSSRVAKTASPIGTVASANSLGRHGLQSEPTRGRSAGACYTFFTPPGSYPRAFVVSMPGSRADPHLADAVIAADPMGVIEYGDADAMTAQQARALFEALETLAHQNPRFWQRGTARAGTLVSLPLREKVKSRYSGSTGPGRLPPTPA